jgi:hypothetical protein
LNLPERQYANAVIALERHASQLHDLLRRVKGDVAPSPTFISTGQSEIKSVETPRSISFAEKFDGLTVRASNAADDLSAYMVTLEEFFSDLPDGPAATQGRN